MAPELCGSAVVVTLVVALAVTFVVAFVDVPGAVSFVVLAADLTEGSSVRLATVDFSVSESCAALLDVTTAD